MGEFIADCPRCPARKITFDVWGDTPTLLGVNGQIRNEALSRCRHCEQCSIAVFKSSGLSNSAANRFMTLTQIKGIIPSAYTLESFVSVANQNTIEPPDHLPANVKACFMEGASAFAIGAWNAASAMFRLTLDLATKGLLPQLDAAEGGPNRDQRKKLFDRLAWLFQTGRLPLGLQELADCVREDGNDAAHDGTLTKSDAEDIIDFSVAILERVYTEPARLANAQLRRKERRGEV